MVARAVGAARHQADAAGEGIDEGGEGGAAMTLRLAFAGPPPLRGEQVAAGRHDAEHQPLAPFEKIGEVEVAFAFRGAAVAKRQQPAEAAVGGAVGGQARMSGVPSRKERRQPTA